MRYEAKYTGARLSAIAVLVRREGPICCQQVSNLQSFWFSYRRWCFFGRARVGVARVGPRFDRTVRAIPPALRQADPKHGD